ncbi:MULTISPECIES: metal ABC transporter permease [unclassified Agarivorans]|uniref:metal ABC transporter permease n=1 Tax=unclassified Agarivorans TaxID=2636026 RepID=UPI0026E29307|nr:MULTISPECIES: metal ABC transporter permease [unclassified Agarivorans]MDO6686677.1 metal ABC transporter permease [Agarivorans sp. 3_MG-2023]MDO6716593.1 metal ABC transporter permease [Agarivorans sp. 2_MG-2023]
MLDLISLLFAPFIDYQFMRRALVGCATLSLGTAPIGVFLMLRRLSLTGDAMAHAILPGVALAYLLCGLSVVAMTIGGLVAGLLVAMLAGATALKTKSSEDSTLAAFYLGSLALGVLLISAKGSNIDLLHVLFGTALALDDTALTLLLITCVCSLVVFTLIYRPLVLGTLDKDYLDSFGSSGKVAHLAFMFLVVANLVAGFHALGTLMAVGLMILPACIARFWTRKLEPMLLLSILLSVAACWAGLLLSYYFGFSTSPSIVLLLAACYLISVVFSPLDGLLRSGKPTSSFNHNNKDMLL